MSFLVCLFYWATLNTERKTHGDTEATVEAAVLLPAVPGELGW